MRRSPKPHLQRLIKVLDSDPVQARIKQTVHYAKAAGLCGDVSALGFVCTERMLHLDEHKAENDRNVVVSSWPNR